MTTKKLLKFLNDEIVPKIPKFKDVKFSNKSSQLMKKLFRNIKSASSKWNNQCLLNKIKYNTVEFRKGKNYFFLNETIKSNVEKLQNGYYCKMNVLKRDVNICVYGNKNIITENFVKQVFRKVYIWLYVAFLYAPTQCSQSLDIYLYLTDMEKVLPNKGEHIDILNANTAFTTTCMKKTEIHIFRYEEWYKVLIHETFHCLGLDFSEMDNEKTKIPILKLFSVKSEVNLSETYCEVWAETLNIMFIAFENDVRENIDMMIYKTENLLKWEQLFSLFQCSKVLDFYGMTYGGLTGGKGQTQAKFKEKANVLAYYILKSIIIFYINDFIEWCVDKNGKEVLNFDKIRNYENNLAEYCGFIREHYKREEFIHIINVLNHWFLERKTVKNEFEMKTMRMSIFG